MTSLYLLLLAIGVAPLLLGLALLKPAPAGARRSIDIGSVLLCALAFNLTFFWQELWLVIPKALTPGLHPVLFHNNHDWTGSAPTVELLQGTGAVATMASGLGFCVALAQARRGSASWRLLFFWMAFQGLYQSLTQLAIGTLLPGNDVGRALAYLGVADAGKITLLAVAVAGMAGAGAWLARHALDGTRTAGYAALLTVLLSTFLILPFRIPRDIVEVGLIPLIVNLVGVAWLILGAARAGQGAKRTHSKASLAGPMLALGALLLFFQCVLRPGIIF